MAAGLSHSEISGSKVICTYPELIAAYRVLHRLREPRHPPCALTYFARTAAAYPYIAVYDKSGVLHTSARVRSRHALCGWLLFS